jgi:secondary thiamine-phosphate synthase enzyme
VIFQTELVVETAGRGTYEITDRINTVLAETVATNGLCHLFIKHTSASLMLCENADPAVRRDLETFMSDLVLDGDIRFTHTDEGPDDMSAHIRSILTQTDLTVPAGFKQLVLGTWQGVYLWEHRVGCNKRTVVLTVQS